MVKPNFILGRFHFGSHVNTLSDSACKIWRLVSLIEDSDEFVEDWDGNKMSRSRKWSMIVELSHMWMPQVRWSSFLNINISWNRKTGKILVDLAKIIYVLPAPMDTNRRRGRQHIMLIFIYEYSQCLRSSHRRGSTKKRFSQK